MRGRARVCVWSERGRERETEGGEKQKNFHLKFVGTRKWMFGRKTSIWGLDAAALLTLCDYVRGPRAVILTLRLLTVNPQHKSAVRPPGPVLGSPRDQQRLEKNVILSRLVECVAVSGDARHSRSKAEDGEELPELQLHRAGQRGGSERGLGLQTQVREGGSPPEENSGDGRPSETNTHLKVSRRI